MYTYVLYGTTAHMQEERNETKQREETCHPPETRQKGYRRKAA